MSEVLKNIKNDFIVARKAREQSTVSFLSGLIGEIESKAVTSSGRIDITDEMVIATLKSFEKRINEFESIDNVSEVMLDQLKFEREIISSYLPKQLTEQELRDIFSTIDTSNMGLMMKYLKENYSGQYDGKIASTIVKEFV